jgi:hypothetical protein
LKKPATIVVSLYSHLMGSLVADGLAYLVNELLRKRQAAAALCPHDFEGRRQLGPPVTSAIDLTPRASALS